MDSKPKLALFLCILVIFGVNGEMMEASAAPGRVAQSQSTKSVPSKTNNKTTSSNDCSLLTPAMIEKVLGQAVRVNDTHKAMPMYGGAWGWSCEYRGEGVRIDFVVYEEATAAKAKQDFNTYSVAADDSAGKPSIGDSAYWVTDAKQEPYLYVLKGKVHFSVGMDRGAPANQKQMEQMKTMAVGVAARI